jgi:hypothetical protein
LHDDDFACHAVESGLVELPTERGVRISRTTLFGDWFTRRDAKRTIAAAWRPANDHFCRMARKAVSLRCPFGD